MLIRAVISDNERHCKFCHRPVVKGGRSVAEFRAESRHNKLKVCKSVFHTGSSIELTKCLEVFAGSAELISKKVMDLLIKMIEDKIYFKNRLQHALKSFTDLKHSTVAHFGHVDATHKQ